MDVFNNFLAIAGILAVFVIPIATSIITQAQNVKNKEYSKVLKFAVYMITSVLLVIVFKYSTLFPIDYVKALPPLDIIVLGVGVGFTCTGAFDTIKTYGIKNKGEDVIQ